MKGRDLTEWRKRWGLTQIKLAQALGVDVMTVSRWERGVQVPTPVLSLAMEALEHRLKKGTKQGEEFKIIRPREGQASSPQEGQMLIVTLKADENVLLGDNIRVKVVEIRGKQVRLGIEAPPGLLILRKKLAEIDK